MQFSTEKSKNDEIILKQVNVIDNGPHPKTKHRADINNCLIVVMAVKLPEWVVVVTVVKSPDWVVVVIVKKLPDKVIVVIVLKLPDSVAVVLVLKLTDSVVFRCCDHSSKISVKIT